MDSLDNADQEELSMLLDSYDIAKMMEYKETLDSDSEKFYQKISWNLKENGYKLLALFRTKK